MAKRVVVLFAGQGAQKVGMGADLAELHPVARERFEEADDALPFSLTEVMFEGPIEELTRTSRCQPALYAHGMVCLELLQDWVPDIKISGAAGLSLGEFTAHAAAGTFDFEAGLRLVAKRGQFMEEATDAAEGTMAAMIGGEQADVEALAKAREVDVANYNAPGQLVISGSREGIAKAIAEAKSHGIKIAKELTVAGAYHSRLMKPAQDQLGEELSDHPLDRPAVPVVANLTAEMVSKKEDIRKTLTGQVCGSVRWSDSMRLFLERGETTFLELGPGGVLAGLMKRIDKNATVISVEDADSLDAAVEALG